jgi:hypothetical protein
MGSDEVGWDGIVVYSGGDGACCGDGACLRMMVV